MPKRFVGGQQERLRKRYFRRLHEVTGGHPLLALYYWLSSLELDDDEIVVHPLEPLRVDHLRRLEEDKLIGLGQLVMHEELTEEGFADVMRIAPEAARRDLAFFESLNLILREPGRRVHFRINEVLYHDIERALVEHNIV